MDVRRLIERRVEVHPADLGGVLADLPRVRVDQPLEDVRGLRAAGTAIRVGRRRVRQDTAELEPVRLGVVRPHVDPPAELGDAGREQLVVRTHVRDLHELQPEDLAVGRAGQRAVVRDATAVDRGDVVLAPLLDPLDGTSGDARQRQRQRFLGIDVQLGAERTADVRRDHAELLLWDAAGAGQCHFGDVRDLCGAPERELAHGRDRRRQAAARLDRVGDQARLVVVLLDDDGCGVEDALVPRPAVTPVDGDVRVQLLVDQRRTVRHRVFRRGDGLQLGHVDR